ncbi:MAG: spermidine/putrescine ABC transporter permease PotB, partial [Angelakisella sp.]
MKQIRTKPKLQKTWMLSIPLIVFTVVFVVLPLVYILVLSFLRKDILWGVTSEFTLDNYKKMLDPVYLKTFRDSLMLAFSTTLLTVLMGYPFGYFMGRLLPKRRKMVMLLVVVPFWTNALVRIYGWMILLRSSGVVNKLLLAAGLIDVPLKILYTY